MAITNYERVTACMGLLRDGLAPYVEREMRNAFKDQAQNRASGYLRDERNILDKKIAEWDVAALLRLMWESWNEVFRNTLGQADRSLVSELMDIRNRWAHQEPFSTDDAYRAMDSAGRLLAAVSAPQGEEIEKVKQELLRLKFDEQVRSERRRVARSGIESPAAGGLRPWREVITPHPDVASGRYQQAEFAADLWQVHQGEGSSEYRDPAEFYRRTFLTEGLRRLLVGALRRLAGQAADPIVQLQTNFGGGKTHSMLALYHLFSGVPSSSLTGMDAVLKEAGAGVTPKVNRAVLVGTKISPGNPSVKGDGTVVRTLWGELAWQLGFAKGGVKEAAQAYGRVKADDERATNPGAVLKELLDRYGPSLILIDEWVAYARGLHDASDLPGGSFETHFTFAQALTEAARSAKQCLLVISLPASDAAASPHGGLIEDVEVGGTRGREALNRLRNVVGRMEASWRPASAEEGFEIVRRRLFNQVADPKLHVDLDTTARAFVELYRSQPGEFPGGTSEAGYERRLKSAYPIHPEIFDRLYTDWSSLVKFQRTRGVLRLMAAVVHSLWQQQDRNPLILPASIPIEDQRVRDELTRYLSDNWVPVIEKDVDGPSAIPLQLDNEMTNLGKYAASRRVARTIYLGSAPTLTAANVGIEDRRIKLGCVMPGESPQIFGDALRHLLRRTTYLYDDGARYWYSTQPTVAKLAEDRAEQLRREPDKVVKELADLLKADLKDKGDFRRVHALPASSADVLDGYDAALVVLSPSPEQAYSKAPGAGAEAAAKEILQHCGNAPRRRTNTLVFLVADANRLPELEEAARRYLAWKSIVDDTVRLNLDPHQQANAKKQLEDADSTVKLRIPETYRWLLNPTQPRPTGPMTLEPREVRGQEPLAVRASKKLRSEEGLYTNLGGSRLRLDLDAVPLWRGDHVLINQLSDDFSRYVYLPRLKETSVLLRAVEDGVSLMLWRNDGFAYADEYDEAAKRYRGLKAGQRITVSGDNARAVLVRPEIADKQLQQEAAAAQAPIPAGPGGPGGPPASGGQGGQAGTPGPAPPGAPTPTAPPRRFHGMVALDPARVGRDAGRIADEVIAHLAGLVGAKVTVRLEIEAEIPSGATEQVVRTVTENSRTLKFESQGFEKD